MIVSSKAVCWTGRVGLVCRDCREALATGEAGRKAHFDAGIYIAISIA
jgi:hypothetical protein